MLPNGIQTLGVFFGIGSEAKDMAEEEIMSDTESPARSRFRVVDSFLGDREISTIIAIDAIIDIRAVTIRMMDKTFACSSLDELILYQLS
mmetsp:Transcript_7626/g.11064  ORF Transcript_7626/g.11064 Transcript_7626/m.11064 type:complete len:90 (-) Transcript_7626:71-340(-)